MIKEETNQMQQLNIELVKQKKNKQKLIEENRTAKSILDQERAQQNVLIADIKNNLSKFTTQLKAKQRESNKIDKEIRKIIQAAIAASNKKAGKSSKSKVFSLTPEQKILAANFTSNKGKLPWPVDSGLIFRRFGKQPHPIYSGNYINSTGIHIATNKGTNAESIFNGEVLAIQTQSEGKKSVLIRHGNYISIYNNLESVYVGNGDKVKTGQALGKIFTDRITGKTKLIFVLSKNTTRLNPTSWIRKN